METSQSERAAVALAKSPTVPLAVLVEAVAVLRALHKLGANEYVPARVLVDASLAFASLGYYVDQMLAAQAVGVTS